MISRLIAPTGVLKASANTEENVGVGGQGKFEAIFIRDGVLMALMENDPDLNWNTIRTAGWLVARRTTRHRLQSRERSRRSIASPAIPSRNS